MLAATATANDRVERDVAAQIGSDTLTFRGSLDRPSLHLGAVVDLPTSAHRLAWLADWVATHPGPGLVYCLTVSEVDRVAAHLADAGLSVAAYTGATDAAERERIEGALDSGGLSCVVATSALGMGYDNAHLAYVVHLGSPSSPIAYYQQVGRAGRGAADASVVLVPTPTEGDIWAYFDATAMPERHVVEEVLATLQSSGPCTVVQLEGLVNLRRGRLEALLKVLDVEGAVDRDGSAWFRTDRPWAYDDERYRTLAAARRAEQDAMRRYRSTAGCRLRFLREALDDPGAQDCGRCDNCTGTAVPSRVDPDAVASAQQFLRGATVSVGAAQAVAPRPGGPQGQHRPGPAAGGGPGPGLRHGPGVGRRRWRPCSPGRTPHPATTSSGGWPPRSRRGTGAAAPPGSPGSPPAAVRSWWRAWPNAWPRSASWTWWTPSAGSGPTHHPSPAWRTPPSRPPTSWMPSSSPPASRRARAWWWTTPCARAGP